MLPSSLRPLVTSLVVLTAAITASTFAFGCSSADEDEATTNGALSSTPTPKTCQGTPTRCDALSRYSCDDVKGCKEEEVCTGRARDCFFLDGYSCSSQNGCFLSGYDADATCMGYASSCDGLTYGCSSQDGCSTEHVCKGTPVACNKVEAEDACKKQGCDWK